jgi:hypothetical protein
VQVGTADRRRGDFDDRIARVEYFWIGHRFDPHIMCPVPADGFHGELQVEVKALKLTMMVISGGASFLTHRSSFIACAFRLSACRRRLAGFHRLFDAPQFFLNLLIGRSAKRLGDGSAHHASRRPVGQRDVNLRTPTCRRARKSHRSGVIDGAPEVLPGSTPLFIRWIAVARSSILA